ncbi:predicted protein [Chaetomium globosum CBS 148.51]|uniref:Uncharacterized protein n=1 Tax=Chaetomium globosum (strain ATCC 6205 / CBS 148.51 / DSM 1962 / NBRC 6347 / NRRL 1970) TaxID=306901 RepID=Q2H891_CHAGB|nr:uncharacterized protein CHGG_03563 [Chaetomium globosum CBS 148.51]EAQ91628.1 predicted protein [Chaetomium globosum CBS 148.51]
MGWIIPGVASGNGWTYNVSYNPLFVSYTEGGTQGLELV